MWVALTNILFAILDDGFRFALGGAANGRGERGELRPEARTASLIIEASSAVCE